MAAWLYRVEGLTWQKVAQKMIYNERYCSVLQRQGLLIVFAWMMLNTDPTRGAVTPSEPR